MEFSHESQAEKVSYRYADYCLEQQNKLQTESLTVVKIKSSSPITQHTNSDTTKEGFLTEKVAC